MQETTKFQKSDAIIVLTGGKGRIDTGFKLLRQKAAKYLFISGVGKQTSLNDLINHLDYENRKIAKNLEKQVILGREAKTTEDNIVEVTNWLEEKNLKSFILVTSNYHIPRTLKLINKLNHNFIIQISPVNNRFNLTALRMLIWEYNKYLFTL